MFQIIYGKKAIKFLKKQDKPTQKRLMTAISRLPLEGDIKKLQGASGYRLRVGSGSFEIREDYCFFRFRLPSGRASIVSW